MSDRTQLEGRSFYTERDYVFTPTRPDIFPHQTNIEWQRGLLWATRVGDPVFDRGGEDSGPPLPDKPILKIISQKPVYDPDPDKQIQCVIYGEDTEWAVSGYVENFSTDVTYSPVELKFYGRTVLVPLEADGTFAYIASQNDYDQITRFINVVASVDAVVTQSGGRLVDLVPGEIAQTQVQFIIFTHRPEVTLKLDKPNFTVGDDNDPVTGQISILTDLPAEVHSMEIELNGEKITLGQGGFTPKGRTITYNFDFTLPNSAVNSGTNLIKFDVAVWMPQFGGEHTTSYTSGMTQLFGIGVATPPELTIETSPDEIFITDTLKVTGVVKFSEDDELSHVAVRVGNQQPTVATLTATSDPQVWNYEYTIPASTVGTGPVKVIASAHVNRDGTKAVTVKDKTVVIYVPLADPGVSIESSTNPVFLDGGEYDLTGYIKTPVEATGENVLTITSSGSALSLIVTEFTPDPNDATIFKWATKVSEDEFSINGDTTFTATYVVHGPNGYEKSASSTVVVQGWNVRKAPTLTLSSRLPSVDPGNTVGYFEGTVSFEPTLAKVKDDVVFLHNLSSGSSLPIPVRKGVTDPDGVITWKKLMGNFPNFFVDGENEIEARAVITFDNGDSSEGKSPSIKIHYGRDIINDPGITLDEGNSGALNKFGELSDWISINGTRGTARLSHFKFRFKFDANQLTPTNFRQGKLYANGVWISSASNFEFHDGYCDVEFKATSVTTATLSWPLQTLQIEMVINNWYGPVSGVSYLINDYDINIMGKPSNYESFKMGDHETCVVIPTEDTVFKLNPILAAPFDNPGSSADTMENIQLDSAKMYILNVLNDNALNVDYIEMGADGTFTIKPEMFLSQTNGSYKVDMRMMSSRKPYGTFTENEYTTHSYRSLPGYPVKFGVQSSSVSSVYYKSAGTVNIHVSQLDHLTFEIRHNTLTPDTAKVSVYRVDTGDLMGEYSTIAGSHGNLELFKIPVTDFPPDLHKSQVYSTKFKIKIVIETNTGGKPNTSYDRILELSFERMPSPVGMGVELFPKVEDDSKEFFEPLFTNNLLDADQSPYAKMYYSYTDVASGTVLYSSEFTKDDIIIHENHSNEPQFTTEPKQLLLKIPMETYLKMDQSSVRLSIDIIFHDHFIQPKKSEFVYWIDVYSKYKSKDLGYLYANILQVDSNITYEPDTHRFDRCQLTARTPGNSHAYYYGFVHLPNGPKPIKLRCYGMEWEVTPTMNPKSEFGAIGPMDFPEFLDKMFLTQEQIYTAKRDMEVVLDNEVIATRYADPIRHFIPSFVQVGDVEFTPNLFKEVDGNTTLLHYRLEPSDPTSFTVALKGKLPSIDPRFAATGFYSILNTPTTSIQESNIVTNEGDLDEISWVVPVSTFIAGTDTNKLGANLYYTVTPHNTFPDLKLNNKPFKSDLISDVVGVARPLAPTILLPEDGWTLELKNGVGAKQCKMLLTVADEKAPDATIEMANATIFGPDGHIFKSDIDLINLEGDTWYMNIDETMVDLRGGNTVQFEAIGQNNGYNGPMKKTQKVDIVIKNI